MKNTKDNKFVYFVSILLSLFFLCSVGLAQDKERKVEDGDWREKAKKAFEMQSKMYYILHKSLWAEETVSLPSGAGKAYYYFSSDDEIICYFLMIAYSNGFYGGRTEYTKQTGKYKVVYDSITIKFPERSITAKVTDSEINGFETEEGKDKKTVWKIQNASSQDKEILRNLGILSEENIKGSRLEENKFSAPADSPIIGTWKYVECLDNDCSVKDNGIYKSQPAILRTSMFIYSQNGVVESRHKLNYQSEPTVVKNNWKYTPKTASSGILEEYQGENLIERANVKFLTRNQLEYKITFSSNSDLVGKQYVWTRQ